MKTETFLRKLSVVLTAAILIVAVSACAHHKATEGQDYGQVRTEASATQSTSSDQVVGTAPAPANAQKMQCQDQKLSRAPDPSMPMTAPDPATPAQMPTALLR